MDYPGLETGWVSALDFSSQPLMEWDAGSSSWEHTRKYDGCSGCQSNLIPTGGWENGTDIQSVSIAFSIINQAGGLDGINTPTLRVAGTGNTITVSNPVSGSTYALPGDFGELTAIGLFLGYWDTYEGVSPLFNEVGYYVTSITVTPVVNEFWQSEVNCVEAT